MRKTPCSFVDISGQTFTYWTVLERADNRHGRVYYKCRCRCGHESVVSKTALEHEVSTSCGCRTKTINRDVENFAKPWTEKEDEAIRKYYPVNGTKSLMAFLGRSSDSIIHRAKKLGVKIPEQRRKVICRFLRLAWSEQELQVLRDHYSKGGVSACLPLLPKRSKNAIWNKAEKLGIKLERNCSNSSMAA